MDKIQIQAGYVPGAGHGPSLPRARRTAGTGPIMFVAGLPVGHDQAIAEGETRVGNFAVSLNGRRLTAPSG